MAANPMPLAELLGIEVDTDDPEHCVCRLTVRVEHLNQGLVPHGGVLFTPGRHSPRAGDQPTGRADVAGRELLPAALPRRRGGRHGAGRRAGRAPRAAAATDTGSPLARALVASCRREVRALSGGEAALDLLPSSLLVAGVGGQPVGCAGLSARTREAAEITALWVHPERRRQGIGRLLVEELERVARDGGHHRLQVDADQRLVSALGLLAASGYAESESGADSATTRLLESWTAGSP